MGRSPQSASSIKHAPLSYGSPMVIKVEPATSSRFDDVAVMVGPKNPSASVCWCLSHRVDTKNNRELVGPARGDYVRELCRRPSRPAFSRTTVKMSLAGRLSPREKRLF